MAIDEICENVFIHIIQNGVSLMAVIKMSCPAITGDEVIPTAGGMCLINDRNQIRIMLHLQMTHPGFFFHFWFTSTSFPITIDSRTARAANIKKSKKTSDYIYQVNRLQSCLRSGTLFNTTFLIHAGCLLRHKYLQSCGRIQIMSLDIK